ncbi:Uncharacterized protein TCAP_01361 [Tolypocladium capitatum]|uniref:Extracellular mutant protein 11 C-terminal domain-containing protein n=1 Tax=Tolypocladium capitatum TaxID=45235 RepID=A0A2K3QMF4_9HYPO|nr:Uncharacterized protein TCAP_01361 [Tolypocladium capitatum]
MPVGLKEKRGRLGAFARQHSDNGANANATAPKNEPEVERPSEAPQVASHGPTRQELAEAARLPVPTGPRYVAAANHQQHGHMASKRPPSPPRVAETSPTSRRPGQHLDHGHGDLFSGSQLGDSFMQSGLSTPQNEPQDLDDEPTPNAGRQSIRDNQNYIKDADRVFPNSDAAAFKMGDDGMMSVVAHLPKRRTLPPLMDGFQDDSAIDEKRGLSNYVADRNHSSSAVALLSTLPMRQVRVKNRPGPSQRTMYKRLEAGSPSPSVESALWQGQRTRDEPRQPVPGHASDEELDSISGHEELRMVSDLQHVRDAKRLPVGGGAVNADAHHRLPKDRKRRRGSADYDDKILTSMTYEELQNEPFDMDPATAAGQNGHDASSKLPLKLEQYRQQGAKEQHHMFSAMSMDDWETSGDWFVDQFADIMNRLRDARRRKRRMMQGFEDETAAREEAVRLRSETIDRKLAKMRQDGQRVVEDKIL